MLFWQNWLFWLNDIRGCLMKNFEKNDIRAQWFLKNECFSTNMDMRAVCYLEIGRFWQNMGWEYWFFRDISEKKASYWLFWPILDRSFDRIDVSWPVICMTAGGFSWKFWSNYMRVPCFERMDVFCTTNGHQSYVFFREWTFFRQNLGERVVIFSWKIVKRASYWLFWPAIYRFFWQNWRL